MLQVWFGPLPEWHEQYRARTDQPGFDWIWFHDLPEFRKRCRERLGVTCPIREGDGKVHDYRAAFGVLFQEELEGYDFWGHTDMDCVYGDLAAFYGPDVIRDADVFTDHWEYLCGPWTMYRNTEEVAHAFQEIPGWMALLEDPVSSGWVETSFTEHLNQSGLAIHYLLKHEWRDARGLHLEGNRLFNLAGEEIPFFHFRYGKRWPL